MSCIIFSHYAADQSGDNDKESNSDCSCNNLLEQLRQKKREHFISTPLNVYLGQYLKSSTY